MCCNSYTGNCHFEKVSPKPKHTVWEDSLGLKKVTWVETITVLKYMPEAIKICKNWNVLIGYSRGNSIFVFYYKALNSGSATDNL